MTPRRHRVRRVPPHPSGTAAGPGADRVHATEHDVVNGHRIDAGAGQQRPDDMRAEVGRVRTGQATTTAAGRGPDRIDYERLGHRGSPRLHC